ncbi:MAG TPA: hypothetical protein VNI83_07160 [Vicinamibacterales bacterium]|nr:hypothetical protein [Vicinamibacterales bacterium]
MAQRVLLGVLVVAVVVLAALAFLFWQHRDRARLLWETQDHYVARIVLYGSATDPRCQAGVDPFRIKARPDTVVVWEIVDACAVPGERRVTIRRFQRVGAEGAEPEGRLLADLPSTPRAVVKRLRAVGGTLYEYEVAIDGATVKTAEFESCPDWPCGPRS